MISIILFASSILAADVYQTYPTPAVLGCVDVVKKSCLAMVDLDALTTTCYCDETGQDVSCPPHIPNGANSSTPHDVWGGSNPYGYKVMNSYSQEETCEAWVVVGTMNADCECIYDALNSMTRVIVTYQRVTTYDPCVPNQPD